MNQILFPKWVFQICGALFHSNDKHFATQTNVLMLRMLILQVCAAYLVAPLSISFPCPNSVGLTAECSCTHICIHRAESCRWLELEFAERLVSESCLSSWS